MKLNDQRDDQGRRLIEFASVIIRLFVVPLRQVFSSHFSVCAAAVFKRKNTSSLVPQLSALVPEASSDGSDGESEDMQDCELANG